MIDYVGMGIDNDLGSFWVVTKPTECSEKEDILFESTVLDMGLQFLGGLKPIDVVLITKDREKANEVANKLIN